MPDPASDRARESRDAPLVLDGQDLTINDVINVTRHGRTVTVGPEAHRRIAAARAIVDQHAAGDEALYGVNTGFGSLARKRIDAGRLEDVQRNLIRSHASGVGEPLNEETVRGLMLLLAASLSRGHSGVRVDIPMLLVDALNNRIHPIVPSRGSVGASGDLAPLAHIGQMLIGEGDVIADGNVTMPAAKALAAASLTPVTLAAKEGLAIINGTHLMTTLAAIAVHDAERLLRAGINAAAMAIDACRATPKPFDDRVHSARRQVGQMRVAARLRMLLEGSAIAQSHRADDPRVQDPYSLRATPQVLGAVYDSIAHVRTIVERELGAVTDNPLVFPEDVRDHAIVSGGNFHGMPIALALDQLAIAITHIAGMSERRVFWLLAAHDPEAGVTPYLSPDPGLHSGLMIAQYASAACCNELQTLATPSSVANVSTCAGIEDYNSFGPASAFRVMTGLDRVRSVVAIEFLVMAAGIDHHRPLASGRHVDALHTRIRSVVEPLREDRTPAPDIAAIEALLSAGELDGPDWPEDIS